MATGLARAQQLFRSESNSLWLTRLDDHLLQAGHQLTLREARIVASDLAWWVRQRRYDDLQGDKMPRSEWVPDSGHPLAALVVAQFLRYDFRFDDLNAFARRRQEDDAFYRAIVVFTKLGTGRDVDESEISQIRDLPDADEKTLHCLLHGMCLAQDPRPWADTIVSIANELERVLPNPDSVVFYRRGLGHKLQGNFAAADADLRRALSSVPPDNVVHQQYAGELAAISTEQQLATQLSSAQDTFARSLDEMRDETMVEISDTLREGLTANFQILAIFLTLAGFVGTAGVTLVRLAESRISAGRAIGTLALLVAFTFIVFAGSRLIVGRGLTKRRRGRG